MDEVVQMMTGLPIRTDWTGRLLRFGSSAIDIFGGLFGAFAAMGALMERQNSGKGRDIRVGLFESGLLFAAQHMVQYEPEGTARHRCRNAISPAYIRYHGNGDGR